MRGLAVLLAAIAASSIALAAPGGRRISANGVGVVVPPGWSRVPAAATHVSDPRTLLVVGTRGSRPSATGCQIASYRVPRRGALVVVVGWTDAGLVPGVTAGRPALRALRSVHRPSFECFSGRGAGADLRLGGRVYQVDVLVGDGASAQTVRRALAVGRSFDLARG